MDRSTTEALLKALTEANNNACGYFRKVLCVQHQSYQGTGASVGLNEKEKIKERTINHKTIEEITAALCQAKSLIGTHTLDEFSPDSLPAFAKCYSSIYELLEIIEKTDSPENDTIELLGLKWDRENLKTGGWEIDGEHYFTWNEAMEAAEKQGKRLPTLKEFKALCKLGSSWDDDLKGRWFGGNHNTDHKGSLFFHAGGLLYSSSGALGNVGASGFYWSSSPYYSGDTYAGYLYFSSGNVYPLNFSNRAFGFPVRLIQD